MSMLLIMPFEFLLQLNACLPLCLWICSTSELTGKDLREQRVMVLLVFVWKQQPS